MKNTHREDSVQIVVNVLQICIRNITDNLCVTNVLAKSMKKIKGWVIMAGCCRRAYIMQNNPEVLTKYLHTSRHTIGTLVPPNRCLQMSRRMQVPEKLFLI